MTKAAGEGAAEGAPDHAPTPAPPTNPDPAAERDAEGGSDDYMLPHVVAFLRLLDECGIPELGIPLSSEVHLHSTKIMSEIVDSEPTSGDPSSSSHKSPDPAAKGDAEVLESDNESTLTEMLV